MILNVFCSNNLYAFCFLIETNSKLKWYVIQRKNKAGMDTKSVGSKQQLAILSGGHRRHHGEGSWIENSHLTPCPQFQLKWQENVKVGFNLHHQSGKRFIKTPKL